MTWGAILITNKPLGQYSTALIQIATSAVQKGVGDWDIQRCYPDIECTIFTDCYSAVLILPVGGAVNYLVSSELNIRLT